jgi:hypothetical protein
MVPGKDKDIHPSMGVSQPYPMTDTLIDKLQNYYGIAIRSNCENLEGMKAAIYASIIHCVSSKKRNLHTWCLDGPDSWCRLTYRSVVVVFQTTSLLRLGPFMID